MSSGMNTFLFLSGCETTAITMTRGRTRTAVSYKQDAFIPDQHRVDQNRVSNLFLDISASLLP